MKHEEVAKRLLSLLQKHGINQQTLADESGVPDCFVEKFGGWKPGSSVMKSIYRNAMQSEIDDQADKILEAFSNEKKTPPNR